MVKHFAIYDQGTSTYHEDGIIITPRIFGVADGVSTPYGPSYPLKMFKGLSGGEMVARSCEYHFYVNERKLRAGNLPLQESIKQLNARIGINQIPRGLSTEYLKDAGELAGATFAFARITAQAQIELIQAGDCMAVIEFKNGEIIVSPNQVRAHDTAMNAEIERIQREVAKELFGLELEDVPDEKQSQVRGEMWDRFYPTLVEARRQDANNPKSPRGYGILNGQFALLERWEELVWERTFHLKNVATVLLFSDGIVPWTVMKSTDDEEIGRTILAEFKRRGLAGLLLSARGIEAENVATAYTNQAEATAVALVF